MIQKSLFKENQPSKDKYLSHQLNLKPAIEGIHFKLISFMTTTAFNEALDIYYHHFYCNAMRLTRNSNNAKDLLQETIMRAFANRDKFVEGSNFKAWLYTIMQHNFINEYRKRQTRSHVVHLLEDNMRVVLVHPCQNNGPSIVMMKELRSMVDDLCVTNRVPFDMFVDGYCYLEIADKLDIPVGTVKSRIFMARKELKHVITKSYGAHVRCA